MNPENEIGEALLHTEGCVELEKEWSVAREHMLAFSSANKTWSVFSVFDSFA